MITTEKLAKNVVVGDRILAGQDIRTVSKIVKVMAIYSFRTVEGVTLNYMANDMVVIVTDE